MLNIIGFLCQSLLAENKVCVALAENLFWFCLDFINHKISHYQKFFRKANVKCPDAFRPFGSKTSDQIMFNPGLYYQQKIMKLRGKKAMEQLQFSVVLEMVRFFERQVTETHHDHLEKDEKPYTVTKVDKILGLVCMDCEMGCSLGRVVNLRTHRFENA